MTRANFLACWALDRGGGRTRGRLSRRVGLYSHSGWVLSCASYTSGKLGSNELILKGPRENIRDEAQEPRGG